MAAQKTLMRYAPGGDYQIGYRPRRCKPRREKTASRHIIRALGLELAKKNGWVH